jgi:hypothetical protein
MGWSQFNIDLADLGVGAVDLNKVKKITIHFNDGSGEAYLDDIAVYINRCVPAEADSDLTGDCIVNTWDLEFLSDRWLIGSYDVVPTAPATGPRVWYKFEDGVNSDIDDSSGNNYNGNYSDGSGNWSSDCYDGGCVNFNGDFVVYADPAAFTTLDPNGAVTVSLWIKGDGSNLPVLPGSGLNYGIMLHAGSEDWNAAKEKLRVTCPQTLGNGNHQVDFYTRPSVSEGTNLEAIAWSTNDAADWIDEWVHYAFVKDTPNSIMRMYRNGELVAENDEAVLPIGWDKDTGNFKFSIGGARADYTTTSYRGQIDDFRLYDYALSQAEILSLAGVSGSYTQKLIVPDNAADIFEDQKVNLRDFAELAAVWLEEILWP